MLQPACYKLHDCAYTVALATRRYYVPPGVGTPRAVARADGGARRGADYDYSYIYSDAATNEPYTTYIYTAVLLDEKFLLTTVTAVSSRS